MIQIIVLVLLTGCGLMGPKPPEPCSREEMLEIQGAYLAQVKVACKKGVPLSSCPSYPAIVAERNARVTRWISCSR